jgi:quinol monooxygenase YgiN
MGYVLAVTWRAKPGQEERVAEILRTMVPLTRQEPGCVHYYAHVATDDPRRFFLFEEYRDEAAFEAHCEADYFKKWVLGEAVPILESRDRLVYRSL